MKKFKSSIIFEIISLIGFYVIRLLTVILIWMNFGESDSGSKQSNELFDNLIIYNLPLIIPAIYLAIWTIKEKREYI